jgi:superfamily I DNA/RNA helicase
MNWALGALDRFSVISNSDAHSPDKLGREATVFAMERSYPGLCAAIRNRGGAEGGPESGPGILKTIEFFPQEGKYHYDGHRDCETWLSPAEAAAAGGICPVCGKALTRGVMGRVLELADRPVNDEEPCPKDTGGTNKRPYLSLIPLREILEELLECKRASKKIDVAYRSLINNGGTELAILSDIREKDLEGLKIPGLSGELLAEAVGRMRSGKVLISPGFDGEYGVIRVFSAGKIAHWGEAGLFDSEPEPEEEAPVIPKPKKKAPKTPEAPEAEATPAEAEAARRLPPPFVPDEDQARVIAHDGKRVLVVAGPGAGKTAVLAARAVRLVEEGSDPSSILAVSFTVKAAAELRERLLKSPCPGAGGIVVSTFHSFCAALLREEGKEFVPDFTILGEGERETILRKICGVNPVGKIKYNRLGAYIETRKRYLLLPGETSPSPDIAPIVSPILASLEPPPPPVPELEALYTGYRDLLKDAALADYEDLIDLAVRLLSSRKETLEQVRRRFKHIFVDEYQDINFSQYVLIRLLVPAGGEEETKGETAPEKAEETALWAIGDPNQAIYSFRGADKRFIDRFTREYPGAIRLELLKSFRCAAPILKAAGRLSGAELTSAAVERGPVRLFRREYPSDKSEAEGIARTIALLLGGASFFALDSGAAGGGQGSAAPEDCAVLVRAASLTGSITRALRDHGIPYQLSGQTLWWQEPPVEDLLQFIEKEEWERKQEKKNPRPALNPANPTEPAEPPDPARQILAAWDTLVKRRRLKEYAAEPPEPVAQLARLAGLFGNLPALTDALSGGAGLPDPPASGVRVMTIHASKGLEFEYVFTAGLEEGILPFTLYDRAEDAAGIDEERRLLYVAMTRARQGLWLSAARSRSFRGRMLSCPPSRFLAELEDLIPLEGQTRPPKRTCQPMLFDDKDEEEGGASFQALIP